MLFLYLYTIDDAGKRQHIIIIIIITVVQGLTRILSSYAARNAANQILPMVAALQHRRECLHLLITLPCDHQHFNFLNQVKFV